MGNGKVYAYNIVVIALFVILAISFQKWWIALLSILFMMQRIEYKQNKNEDNKE